MRILYKMSALAVTAAVSFGVMSAAQADPQVVLKIKNLASTPISWTQSGPNGTAITPLPQGITTGNTGTGIYSVTPVGTPANGVFTYTASGVGGHSCGYSYSRSGSCVLTTTTQIQQVTGSICTLISNSVTGSGSTCTNTMSWSLQ